MDNKRRPSTGHAGGAHRRQEPHGALVRKPYSAPRLWCYGDVRGSTMGVTGFQGDSGAPSDRGEPFGSNP